MSKDPFEPSFFTLLIGLVVVTLLAVLAGTGLFGLLRLAPPSHAAATAPAFTPSPYERLEEFYAGCLPACVNLDHVAEVVVNAEEATAHLCIEDELKTFLAIVHRESSFNPKTDDGDSRGVAQVRRRYEKRLRKAWSALGVKLGPITEIRTQVFMGVMVFRDKLRKAEGYTLGAVVRYNGSGDKAELYAYRVLASRGRIFPDAPWTPNERAELLQECP
jgi:hypothetical protein